MDIGEPTRKVTVVPLHNPVPDTVKEGPMREPVKEPAKEPERVE